MGREAAEILCKEISSGAPIDKHMGDIMVPYLAVADGSSEMQVSEITPHTITNIKVAEILTGVRIKLEGELRKPGRIAVSGMALKT